MLIFIIYIFVAKECQIIMIIAISSLDSDLAEFIERLLHKKAQMSDFQLHNNFVVAVSYYCSNLLQVDISMLYC